MRTVTVSFVTVIELTAPCWTRSNRNKMKPLLISITSFLQEVLTATGRPVRYRPLGRLFYCSTTTHGSQRISRRGGSVRTPPCTSQGENACIEQSALLPVWGKFGGSDRGEAMIIGKNVRRLVVCSPASSRGGRLLCHTMG